jgi:hypothetical protein
MIIVLWTGYPIIFALTEGKGRISVDAEVICYGILDVVSPTSAHRPLRCVSSLPSHANMNYSLLRTAREDRLWLLPPLRSLSL